MNHKNNFVQICSFGLTILITMLACGETSPSTVPAPTPTQISNNQLQANRIQFPGVGAIGIFDPSLTERGDGRIWMSYSAVEETPLLARLDLIDTRIAFSENQGADWEDLGIVVNAGEIVQLPPPDDALEVIWRHEVSRLLYDPFAPEENQWILMWHEYLTFFNEDSRQAERILEYSWISVKTAPSPEGPWSFTRRIFTGSIYSHENDGTPPGQPEYLLHDVFSGSTDLGKCMVYTEPGLLARQEGIYISMKCFENTNSGKVILLKCGHVFDNCEYLGDLLNDSEADEYGEIYTGFSATELFAKDEHTYLIITPTTNLTFPYRGCLIFRFDNLETASLESAAGIPIVFFSVFGEEGSFNGACGYTPGSSQSGVIYSQLSVSPRIEFRLFASRLNPE